MKKQFLAFIFPLFLYALPVFSQTMEWHVRDRYVDVQYLGNNLFKVKNENGKWGVVNEYGEMSVAAQYDSITHLVENRALLLDITGQYLQGIINQKGQLIKTFNNKERLANCPYYKEGMLAYGVIEGSYYLFGYMDQNGNTVIKPKYWWAAPFNNGMAVIQYSKTGNYGLIYASGSPALNDNRKFKFMSTPVGGKMLIAVAGSKGDRLMLVRLDAKGKLDNVEELENWTIVRNSPDYRSVSCQNGHTYYMDDNLRLLSSSAGRVFNKPEDAVAIPVYDGALKSMEVKDGSMIMYGDKVLSRNIFGDVSFHGDGYAVVTSPGRGKGILKFNKDGMIEVSGIPQSVEFYHRENAEGIISIDISGMLPATEVGIGIVGLNDSGLEERYGVQAGFEGTYRLPVSWFIPSERFDVEVHKPIKVNIYIDGMPYGTEEVVLTGVHRRGYEVVSVSAPEFSDSDGNATIRFSVQALDSVPDDARITVRGSADLNMRFSGNDRVGVSVPVKVPYGTEKTFTFSITVKEDGCPAYSRKISRTIKSYYLQ